MLATLAIPFIFDAEFQYVSGNSGRKAEVLKLMAQVLEFDEEMQQRVVTASDVLFPALELNSRFQVGLAGKGWLTWLSGSSARPADETQARRYVFGRVLTYSQLYLQNIGDMWVKFLLESAKPAEDNAGDPRP